jgi:hypothetical protein
MQMRMIIVLLLVVTGLPRCRPTSEIPECAYCGERTDITLREVTVAEVLANPHALAGSVVRLHATLHNDSGRYYFAVPGSAQELPAALDASMVNCASVESTTLDPDDDAQVEVVAQGIVGNDAGITVRCFAEVGK